MDFEQKFSEYQNSFNISMTKMLKGLTAENNLISEAMTYALDGGGKRIRPILCLSVADMLSVEFDEVINYALAIECIHTYSLVHDDLPSMDNDDYRRGRLATHKKFGEAFGILAGDALLNFAFETMLNKPNFSSNDVEATKLVGEFAGKRGMIYGQTLDLLNEKQPQFNEEILYEIYLNKTSKLLTAPILVASILSGKKHFEKLKEFGENLGILFQITDDILDVESDIATLGKTPNKDGIEDKLTAIKVFNLDGAKIRAKEHYEKCIEILSEIENSDFLIKFTEKIYNRKK